MCARTPGENKGVSLSDRNITVRDTSAWVPAQGVFSSGRASSVWASSSKSVVLPNYPSNYSAAADTVKGQRHPNRSPPARQDLLSDHQAPYRVSHPRAPHTESYGRGGSPALPEPPMLG